MLELQKFINEPVLLLTNDGRIIVVSFQRHFIPFKADDLLTLLSGCLVVGIFGGVRSDDKCYPFQCSRADILGAFWRRSGPTWTLFGSW